MDSPKVIDNRYQVEKLLGKGGMGTVYKCRDTLKDRTVALKILDTRLVKAGELHRFEREFKVLAELKYEYIARAYDFGYLDKTTPYFTMEYVDGDPLNMLVGKVEFPLCIEMIAHLLYAIDFIHTRGLLHRDIKPANVIRTPQRTMLMDFGLVGSVDLRTQQKVRGTIGYIAPEVLQGEATSAASDLYSLGVIFYELVTGYKPFYGDDVGEVFRKQVLGEYISPSRIVDWIPRSVEGIIARLLAVNPRERYHFCFEVLQDLDSAIGSEYGISLPKPERIVLTARMVDRQPQFETLKGCLQGKMVRSPSSSLVIMEGELGVGKTRIAEEFKIHCQLNRIQFYRIDLGAAASSPFLPLIQLFREMLRLERIQLENLDPQPLGALSVLLPEIKHTVEFDESIVPDDFDRRIEWINEGLGSVLRDGIRQYPVVIFLDDLQLLDPQSIRFFEHYLLQEAIQTTLTDDQRAYQGLSVLILGTYDSDEAHIENTSRIDMEFWRRPSISRLVKVIELKPFDLVLTSEFIKELIGDIPQLSVLAPRILDDTSGKPLFILELMQNLVDRDVLVRSRNRWELAVKIDSLETETSLDKILLARLQRLPDEQRQLLLFMSVLGKNPSFEMLQEYLGLEGVAAFKMINGLKQGNFISDARQLGRDVFVFKHGKLKDLLHKNLQLHEKIMLHRRAGRLIERLYKDDIDDHIFELCRHFYTSEDYHKALDYSLLAAEKSLQLYDHPGSIDYFSYAINCIDHIGDAPSLVDKRLQILNRRAEVYFKIGDGEHALADLEEIRIIAERTGDSVALARAHGNMGYIYTTMGRTEEAIEAYKMALDMSDKANDPSLIARLTLNIGNLYSLQGDLGQASQYFARSLEHAHKAQDISCQVTANINLGVIASLGLDQAQALKRLKQAHRSAIENKLYEQQIKALIELASLYYDNDELELADTSFDEAMSLAVSIKSVTWQALCHAHRAQVYIDELDIKSASKHVEHCNELLDKAMNPRAKVTNLINQGYISLLTGDLKAAEDDINQAKNLSEELGERLLCLNSIISSIEAAIWLGRFEEAEFETGEQLSSLEGTGFRAQSLQIALLMAQSLLGQRKRLGKLRASLNSMIRSAFAARVNTIKRLLWLDDYHQDPKIAQRDTEQLITELGLFAHLSRENLWSWLLCLDHILSPDYPVHEHATFLDMLLNMIEDLYEPIGNDNNTGVLAVYLYYVEALVRYHKGDKKRAIEKTQDAISSSIKSASTLADEDQRERFFSQPLLIGLGRLADLFADETAETSSDTVQEIIDTDYQDDEADTQEDLIFIGDDMNDDELGRKLLSLAERVAKDNSTSVEYDFKVNPLFSYIVQARETTLESLADRFEIIINVTGYDPNSSRYYQWSLLPYKDGFLLYVIGSNLQHEADIHLLALYPLAYHVSKRMIRCPDAIKCLNTGFEPILKCTSGQHDHWLFAIAAAHGKVAYSISASAGNELLIIDPGNLRRAFDRIANENEELISGCEKIIAGYPGFLLADARRIDTLLDKFKYQGMTYKDPKDVFTAFQQMSGNAEFFVFLRHLHLV